MVWWIAGDERRYTSWISFEGLECFRQRFQPIYFGNADLCWTIVIQFEYHGRGIVSLYLAIEAMATLLLRASQACFDYSNDMHMRQEHIESVSIARGVIPTGILQRKSALACIRARMEWINESRMLLIGWSVVLSYETISIFKQINIRQKLSFRAHEISLIG